MEFDLNNVTEQNNHENEEIYKLWSRGKDQSRFLSVKYFKTGKKFVIDVGLSDSNNKLINSTSVYVDAIVLLAYLKAINSGNGGLIYPESPNPKHNLHTNEAIAIFGGGKVDGKPIARVFKTHYWQTGSTYDPSAFVWKCAHFNAKESSTGAYIQSDSNPLSSNSIKVTRKNLAEMEILLNMRLLEDV